MMKSYKPFLPALIVGVMLVGVGIHARAQGPGGPGGGPGRGPGGPGGPEQFLFAQLSLTDAQKEQVKSIRESARAASEPFREQLKTVRDEIQAATANGAFDEATVRAIAAKAAPAEVELAVIDARTRAAVYNVLTPEQRTKLAALQAEFEQRRGGPRPNRS
jgi:periplasmic protein CpxP/Spy